jgi:pyruvate dehydrogenase E1 component alpha subunit
MILNDFDPKENKIVRLIDNDGKVIRPDLMPDLDDETLLKAYHAMLFARVADEMAVSYQRQGRMYTYPPNMGQEAIAVAAGMVMRHDDWLIPVFRELGTWLAKGIQLKEVFLYYMGNEEGSHFKQAHHVLPFSVPIASQLLHAVGIGFSINYFKKEEVAFTFVGDGGTSEGDFSEALNFAAVWKTPVVFTIQNNQYAISVPVRNQTKSINLAVKSMAFGMPGVQVDGNDFFAMYATYQEALSYAASGKGPVLIEAVTYRKGSHTTSDDPTKYRNKEEEEAWEKTDPLSRMKSYLQQKGVPMEDEQELREKYRSEVDQQFEEAEHSSSYPLEDVFQYMYADMPADLQKQKEDYRQFLTWKEKRK